MPDMTRCTACNSKLAQDKISPYCPVCYKRHTYEYNGKVKTTWLSRLFKKYQHRRRARLRREAKRKYQRIYGGMPGFDWQNMGEASSPKDIYVRQKYLVSRKCKNCGEWQFNSGEGWRYYGAHCVPRCAKHRDRIIADD